jgi:hypothetical protein
MLLRGDEHQGDMLLRDVEVGYGCLGHLLRSDVLVSDSLVGFLVLVWFVGDRGRGEKRQRANNG